MTKGLKIALLLALAGVFFTACSGLQLGGASKNYKTHKQVKHKKKPSKPSEKGIYDTLFDIERQWANTPYKLGGTNVRGADCSGFVQSAFREHFDTDIPRSTITQINDGVSVGRDELEAGDIVFFRTGRGPNGLHNGIYVGDDEFIHLSTKHRGVKKVSINSGYWKGKFIGARRYLE